MKSALLHLNRFIHCTTWTRPVGFIFLGVLTLTTFACAAIIPPAGGKATPTPTGQIGPIEAGTPALTGNKKDWQVWSATITSRTSRKYMANGSIVNTCETDWATDIMFTIDPMGDVDGVGTADLSAEPSCSPIGISGNITSMSISVKGRKDQTAIYLNLGITDHQPTISADFGGYTLLITNGACPPVMQSITIPLTSPTAAQTQLNLNAIMTGCAGSRDDQMNNQSQVKLVYRFKCGDNPFNGNDPTAETLCQ